MSNYQRNQQTQAQNTGNQLMVRLTQNHLALTEDTQQTLVSQGITHDMLPIMAAGCLSIGVPPNLLRYTHNVPTVVNAVKLITDYGYRPGEDFYVSVFKTNVDILDENGEPTDQKAKAPTVVVMPSATRLEENGKEDDRLRGLLHIVETGIVEDPKEAKRIFDDNFKGKRSFKDAVVAYAELYVYHAKSGNPLGSGKPQGFYGFYAPWKINQKGEPYLDYNEANKDKDNYEAPAIARKRAASKAWRAVSRNNYPRDNRTVDMRQASLLSHASTRLAELEQKSAETGYDIEQLIEYSDTIPDKKFVLQDKVDYDDDWQAAKEAPATVVEPDVSTWPTDDETLQRLADIADLTEEQGELLVKLRSYHQGSEGPMGGRSLAALATELNFTYGNKAAWAILSAICGRIVSSDNPPGEKLDALIPVLESRQDDRADVQRKYADSVKRLDDLVDAIKAQL